MDVIQTPSALQKRALAYKHEGRVIGFVPTMGSLHEGHLELMRLARKQCDILVVSIFVNPIQFGPNEDLSAYPRDFTGDQQLCAEQGADVIFYPAPENMYAADATTFIDEDRLSAGLCGASRSGHFRGVCTVVAKLFNIVQPDLAVFGEKDAQQLRVIERMVRDLNYPVKIIRGAIVREADGLAMSSRNQYLSEDERQQALCLRRSLDDALTLFKQGERAVEVMRDAMLHRIRKEPAAEVDYIEFVHDSSLERVYQIEGDTLVALAVKIGSTRLIDNDVLRV